MQELDFASVGRVPKGPTTLEEIRARADAMVLAHMQTGQGLTGPVVAGEYDNKHNDGRYKPLKVARLLRWTILFGLVFAGVVLIVHHFGRLF